VDWGHLGSIDIDDQEHKLNGFTFTLGYSRTMMAEAALDQKLGTLLKMMRRRFASSAACRRRSSTAV
jgi:transposase